MAYSDLIKLFRVKPGKPFHLDDYDSGWAQTERLSRIGKQKVRERTEDLLQRCLEELAEAQELLWADNRYSVLMVLQALDAAGKDSTIKHVMSGVNPQGCQVYSFKVPSAEELDHTFLWRCMVRLPERGRIGIFNRSYYEDVLVTRVHPELLEGQNLPPGSRGKAFWKARYDDINALEHHLVRNGTLVLKFFLNVSKSEQKQRFLDRLNDPEKHWKFSFGDLAEREHWDEYVDAYEQTIRATSTEHAPWYVVPADHKWVTRAVVASILVETIRSLNMAYPEVTDEQKKRLEEARRRLLAES